MGRYDEASFETARHLRVVGCDRRADGDERTAEPKPNLHQRRLAALARERTLDQAPAEPTPVAFSDAIVVSYGGGENHLARLAHDLLDDPSGETGGIRRRSPIALPLAAQEEFGA